ncbi:hypothetical membrane spanning protein [Picrophilus oshimae DSM 9789]|uniref:Hypothetical membrane spanning protein n=2 Tax=Picrophilus oshimae TaxID=46632 RepID=Q6KZF5_PICTO|nr:hypothetical membrane spanning protein [Picrophilus oshimae DSM 9789]
MVNMSPNERITVNEISILFFIIPLILFGFFGYLNIYAIILESLSIILSFIFLFISNINIETKKINYEEIFIITGFIMVFATITFLPLYIYYKIIILTGISAFFIYMIYKFRNNSIYSGFERLKNPVLIYTIITLVTFSGIILANIFIKYGIGDEYIIDSYASMKFLSGKNPYIPENMSGLFSYFSNFNLDYSTPIMTGGYVHIMDYPALAFIVYLPYKYIGRFSYTIISGLSIIPFILIYKSIENKKLALFAMMSLLINIPFLYVSYAALIGILWASMLMISYYYINKNIGLSGIFFGLAVSAKQFPAIIFPFMLYMIYRESGLKAAAKWVSFIIMVFLLINGYFIYLSPVHYIKAVLAPEILDIYGIGYGISQISFLGYAYIPKLFFSIAFFGSIILFLILYIMRYDEFKYALFVFPVLIMFFNYRVLLQYFTYWPIISIIGLESVPYARKIRIDLKTVKRVSTYAFSILLVLIIVFIPVNILHENTVHFDSLSLERGDNSTFIYVTVTYTGKVPTEILFRGIINQTNYNGMIFNEKKTIVYPGETVTIKLLPVRGEKIPSNFVVRMVAYYKNNLGYSNYMVKNNKVYRISDLLYIPPQNKLSLNPIQP